MAQEESGRNIVDAKVVKINPEKIIGLPPTYNMDPILQTKKYTLASMPVCRLIPARPSILDKKSEGLHLFSLDHTKGAEHWRKIVNSCSPTSRTYTIGNETITLPVLTNEDRYLDIAYIHETSISETFSQEYGSSMFEAMANTSSATLGELRQVTGTSSGKEALDAISKKVGDIGGLTGSALEKAIKAVGSLVGVGESILNKFGGNTGTNILTGSRIDFPAIWKGASYNTGHSILVRLYNPMPNSADSYIKYIIFPLMQLLGFVVPLSDQDSFTYNAPCMCSVKCSGLWAIRAGFISSIEVIKGGEANEVNWRQRPNMIDLRLSFGELYGAVPTHAKGQSDRPTFQKYIEVLLDEPKVDLDIYNDEEMKSEDITNTNDGASDLVEGITKRNQDNKNRQNQIIKSIEHAPEVKKNLDLTGDDIIAKAVELIDVISSISSGDSFRIAQQILDSGACDAQDIADSSTEGPLHEVNANCPSEGPKLASSMCTGIKQGLANGGATALNKLISNAMNGDVSVPSGTKTLLSGIGSTIDNLLPDTKFAFGDSLSSSLNGAVNADIGNALGKGAIGLLSSNDMPTVKDTINAVTKAKNPIINAYVNNGGKYTKLTVEGTTGFTLTGSSGSTVSLAKKDVSGGLDPENLSLGYGKGLIRGSQGTVAAHTKETMLPTTPSRNIGGALGKTTDHTDSTGSLLKEAGKDLTNSNTPGVLDSVSNRQKKFASESATAAQNVEEVKNSCSVSPETADKLDTLQEALEKNATDTEEHADQVSSSSTSLKKINASKESETSAGQVEPLTESDKIGTPSTDDAYYLDIPYERASTSSPPIAPQAVAEAYDKEIDKHTVEKDRLERARTRLELNAWRNRPLSDEDLAKYDAMILDLDSKIASENNKISRLQTGKDQHVAKAQLAYDYWEDTYG